MGGFDKPILGAVYLIEQAFAESTWREDLTNIHNAGLRLVVLWPPISRWDSEDGVSIAFNSVDKVMNICAELGLKVILELEGQNPAFQFMPDYLFKDEYFSIDDTGKHWVNYLHPEVDKIICGYCREVAAHFKNHPALLGYDLFNEVNFRSTDHHTVSRFQKWLKKKYGEISDLNRIWGRFYRSFNQITVKNFDYAYSNWSSLRPKLDFQDFRSDTINYLLKRWGKAVRSADKAHPLIADNSWSMTFFENLSLGNDDWKVAKVVDVFGLSVYPQSWDIHIAGDPCAISQIYNGGRSAAQKSGVPVMVSELQTHNQTMLARNSSVFDEIRLWTWQAFMYGMQSLVYWKWRPFSRGFQVTGRGMTLQNGTPNDRSVQASSIAHILNKFPEAFAKGRIFDSGVGLLYNPECDSLTDLTLPDEKSGFYRDSFAGWYRFLYNMGIRPLIIRPEEVGSRHTRHLKLIVAPCTTILSSKDSARFGKFIEGGGKVLADGRFAIVDENIIAWENAPGGLTEAFGYRELDFLSPYADKKHSIAERFSVIELSNAKTPIKTTEGHPVFAGTASTLYIPTFFGHNIAHEFYAETVREFISNSLDYSFRIIECSKGMDVTFKVGDGVLVGMCNYSKDPQKVVVRLKTDKKCKALWENKLFDSHQDGGATVLETVVPPRDVAGFYFA